MNRNTFQRDDAHQLRLRRQAGRKAPAATIERRLALVCAEQGISDAELQKYRGPKKNSKVFDYHRFSEEHRVSLSWLFDGDLRGLYLMAAGLELDGPQKAPPLPPGILAMGEWLRGIARAEIERAFIQQAEEQS
jgi:hypothetical protein